MPLNDTEKLLVEAIGTLLRQDAKLGLAFHDNNESQIHERGFEYLHEEITDMFAIKAAELDYTDSVMRAFNKIHNYKYIDDYSFMVAMDKEMVTTGVPKKDRDKALKFVKEIVDELREENEHWSERDAGFNPNIEEVTKVNKPKQTSNFTIQNRRLNKQNISKQKPGEASPSRTPKKPPTPKDGYDAKSNKRS